ncbi:MAG: 50S ribosomal protein L5 [Patescibacteria group bacterium]
MDRLRSVYQQALPELAKELGLANVMAVPRVRKVTINVGLNEHRHDEKKIARVFGVLGTIAGQKPNIRRSKKAIASFKLRANEPVGLALTLRGNRMYDFLERFIRIVLPRVRDFRGISPKSFDRSGNLTVGLKDLSVFPEIAYENLDVVRGLEVTLVLNARSAARGAKVLAALGFPLIKS